VRDSEGILVGDNLTPPAFVTAYTGVDGTFTINSSDVQDTGVYTFKVIATADDDLATSAFEEFTLTITECNLAVLSVDTAITSYTYGVDSGPSAKTATFASDRADCPPESYAVTLSDGSELPSYVTFTTDTNTVTVTVETIDDSLKDSSITILVKAFGLRTQEAFFEYTVTFDDWCNVSVLSAASFNEPTTYSIIIWEEESVTFNPASSSVNICVVSYEVIVNGDADTTGAFSVDNSNVSAPVLNIQALDVGLEGSHTITIKSLLTTSNTVISTNSL
jgi:hypothetical protein